jgi:hypothetical protein
MAGNEVRGVCRDQMKKGLKYQAPEFRFYTRDKGQVSIGFMWNGVAQSAFSRCYNCFHLAGERNWDSGSVK